MSSLVSCARVARHAACAIALLILASACTDAEEPSLGAPATTAVASDTLPAAAPRLSEMVRFVEPADGAEVYGPVSVVMEANEDLLLAPSSNREAGAGHFAILVDRPCIAEGELMPGDQADVLHFADGGTEKTLDLATGRRQLCLQFQTSGHIATGHTETITITVR